MGGECYVKVESCIECVVSQENDIYTTPICVAVRVHGTASRQCNMSE